MADLAIPNISLEDVKAQRISEINHTTMNGVIEILEQSDANWSQSDMRSCVSAGKSLKEQIMSASTLEDVVAIVDSR